MVTYEEVCDELLRAAEDDGLYVFDIQDRLDVRTCEKSFDFACAPDEAEPPYEVRAEVGFVWDVQYTALSMYGPECDVFHDEGEPCLHQAREPEAYIELEIRYTFPVVAPSEAAATARRIQGVIVDHLQHENLPAVTVEATLTWDGEGAVHQAYAHYGWMIELGDEPLDVTGIFQEIRRVLVAIIDSGLADTNPSPN